MKTNSGHPEIGDKIANPRDIAPGTVVVISPPGIDAYLSVRVLHIENDMIWFRGVLPGGGEIVVINGIRPDNTVVDDQGRVVEVYAYLGDDA